MTTATATLPSRPATPKEYTPEDLLALPESVQYELVDGQLLERAMSSKSSWVGGELFACLREFARKNHLGWVWPADQSYQCFAHEPKMVRKPDVSFLRFGRLPGERLTNRHCRLAPDLAVEVLSPRDYAEVLERKISDYQRAGIRLVWVISPSARTARVHREGRPNFDLKEQDELDGEDVIPGFRCRLGDLLPPRPAIPADPSNP